VVLLQFAVYFATNLPQFCCKLQGKIVANLKEVLLQIAAKTLQIARFFAVFLQGFCNKNNFFVAI
jgi:hypothetical protein